MPAASKRRKPEPGEDRARCPAPYQLQRSQALPCRDRSGATRSAAARYPDPDRGVRSKGLTFLDTAALLDLYDRVAEIEQHSVPGAIVEAGCARGGSAIVMAAAKRPDRPLYVYAIFGMIPPPSQEDGQDAHSRYDLIRSGNAGTGYYGYESDLLDQVRASFAAHGLKPEHNEIRVVQGLFEDTLSVTGPVALAHIGSTGTGRS